MERLSKAQQEILDALNAGVRVLRSDDYPKHWVRSDTWKKCTKTAQSILEARLVNVHRAEPPVRFYGHELRISTIDKAEKGQNHG